MTNPIEIAVGKKGSGAENVEHIYHMVHAKTDTQHLNG